jgi:hypothetical protein
MEFLLEKFEYHEMHKQKHKTLFFKFVLKKFHALNFLLTNFQNRFSFYFCRNAPTSLQSRSKNEAWQLKLTEACRRSNNPNMKTPCLVTFGKSVSEEEARRMLKEMGDPTLSDEDRKRLSRDMFVIMLGGNHTLRAHLQLYLEGFLHFGWLECFACNYLPQRLHSHGIKVLMAFYFLYALLTIIIFCFFFLHNTITYVQLGHHHNAMGRMLETNIWGTTSLCLKLFLVSGLLLNAGCEHYHRIVVKCRLCAYYAGSA